MRTANLVTSITENEMWKQEIKDLESENIHFKIILANLLANNIYKDQIERSEYFQNMFLKMDEQLNLLRHEVREQLHLLQNPGQSSIQQLKNIRDYQRRLEVKMIILREKFGKVAGDFNNFLIDNTG
ncbi:hypothetical protein GFS24_09405 [Chitinophaga sp. SYP-B3965]|uniref:hypothetical protein n=1 Tax=Chitinophaga sp. SYP-B3965 TaxID=2663120 RepID=UPI0012996677|nr:hypothetical protein [Chitinophaga sp. SYP-B3965]MRG45332.1 hypothetical protein [Chitinophaga sp. SYP-B3965]